jgi:DNA-binding beta-propeller fold protein YncE
MSRLKTERNATMNRRLTSTTRLITAVTALLCLDAAETGLGQQAASAGYLLVTDWGGDKVVLYDGATGEFVDRFVPKHSGGMNQPYGILFGPHDGNLYVSTGDYGGPGQLKAVLRYDGATGEFIDNFTIGGNLESPRGIIFGPDGNLYVVDKKVDRPEGRVARFNGLTGAFLGDFVPCGSGGLKRPAGLVFGPSVNHPSKLDLYVTSALTQNVLRYDGVTGAFRGEFVASGSGGLAYPVALTFGPDGNLYVASGAFGALNSSDPEAVFRYQGPSGETPGAFIDLFVPSGSGGLQLPFGLIFGPDGNGDGYPDLYVANSDVSGASNYGKKATVKRYDGLSGAFIDTFVEERSGRLDDVALLTFTQTDPVTLEYTGD